MLGWSTDIITKGGTRTVANDEFDPENSESLDFLKEMIRNRPGGEDRPQQQKALLSIEKALSCNEHLLIQAGTGTGKSFATLIPAIMSGKRVVYSTATKQLSEQLYHNDLPTLKQEAKRQGTKEPSFSLLKGRDNYLCLKKLNELTSGDSNEPDKTEQAGLFEELDMVDVGNHTLPVEPVVEEAPGKKGRKPTAAEMQKEYEQMFAWAGRAQKQSEKKGYVNPDDGDRSGAPAVAEETWRGFSVNNNDCIGRNLCPFASECFSEAARMNAKTSQVVVTNHAVTALDLISDDPEKGMLGGREVYIFDEVHELDNFLSSAWGTVISEHLVTDAMKRAKKFQPSPAIEQQWSKLIDEIGVHTNDLSNRMLELEDGLIWPKPLSHSLRTILEDLAASLMRVVGITEGGSDEAEKETIRRAIVTVVDAIYVFLDNNEENVRWVKNELNKEEDEWIKKNRKGKKKDPAPPSLHAAPIRIGPRLMERLHEREATMVGTSATITVGGRFESPVHNFALSEKIDGEDHRKFDALDVGTPFDYSKQAMLYIPNPSEFPTADYKNREAHSAAVEDTVSALVEATGGRGLILTTTTRRINEVADRLEDDLAGKNIRVLRQGEMPAPQLIDAFVNDETSVLVATMGMWHGLNAEGPTCMLVVMDKIPFPTMDDPLATARKSHADQNGGSGFMDVYVASANVRLAQGFGRLVRTMNDRGIVAILDTRMETKQYGRAMKKSFPPGVRTFNDEKVVVGAAQRLREAREQQIEAGE